ncbi:MAG: hypothetical protein JWP36_1364 [Paucimonas sp.]|nr:hypothetical protein [Paucimonas sp.]
MELHQIQLSYNQEQDRVLLRATFRDKARALHEVRAWLTRRIVVRLWPGIVRAMEAKVTLEQPQAQHAKREIVGMVHQASINDNVQRGGFAKKFEETAVAHPLGTEPLLVTIANFHLKANQPVRIEFVALGGKRFEFAFSDRILHGFCKLLQDAVKNAEWELDLVMPGLDQAPVAPGALN